MVAHIAMSVFSGLSAEMISIFVFLNICTQYDCLSNFLIYRFESKSQLYKITANLQNQLTELNLEHNLILDYLIKISNNPYTKYIIINYDPVSWLTPRKAQCQKKLLSVSHLSPNFLLPPLSFFVSLSQICRRTTYWSNYERKLRHSLIGPGGYQILSQSAGN